MPSNLLNRPFVGITLSKRDYSSVRALLPTPSYTDILYSSYQEKRIEIIYQLEGAITSSPQFRAVSYLKIALRDLLFVPFEWVDEFIIGEDATINNLTYRISELSKAFRSVPIIYHKIYYPKSKKELYKHLLWWGGRLHRNRLYTKEAIVSTAIEMNSKIELSQRYSSKELHAKAYAVYRFILENRNNFKEKLVASQLKEAHKKGAVTKNKNQANQTKQKIEKLIASGDFTKSNGKLNKTAIGKALEMDRRTIAKYL